MKILLFGATGTAGAGVLRACLQAPDVEQVRVIARRAPKQQDARIQLFLHSDFLSYNDVRAAFADVDACFFCLGISATQVPDEAAYRRITRDYPVAAADTLKQISPGATFHYLSGQGASPNSRLMWARVKGDAEAELMRTANAVCWRPAYIAGELSDGAPLIQKLAWPFSFVLKPFPDWYIDAEALGRAMLQATREKLGARVVGNREIRRLAGQ